MAKLIIDTKLLGSIIIAHLLLYITFRDSTVFWYLYTGAMLFLISYVVFLGKSKEHERFSYHQILLYGILSGVLLYMIFRIGNMALNVLPTRLDNEVIQAYRRFSPHYLWHYISLVLILIPGEEIFWRGFVQARLMKIMDVKYAVLLSAVISASVYLYCNLKIMMIITFIASVFWGLLYAKKRDMPTLILSHLTFDVLLIFIFPIY
ncbi:CPBP family intramembrane glutamic endopeptidase [Heyndrickxia acidiproducens]|uniref:CPBP family intramembrane glutamic endopeptidase n=1 Tax=Heyndrickxia acidiproducens TaxID=1121084 RepID=UPI000381BFD0|nr:type II CAAX endopeptidase family protein [Heyndrickxia acidiproducens]